MPVDRAFDVEAGFESGRSGRLFRVRFLPAETPSRASALFIHGFGEEMNRSRHVVAETARRLAADGVEVELLDLFGCGDSEGSLADATVERWLLDLEDRVRVLDDRLAGPLHLWGLRAGALLAAALAQRLDDGLADGALVLWQPVLTGKQVVSDLLRLRTAAALTEGGSGESRDDLRARLADGELLEVAGYPLAPGLVTGLEALALGSLRPGRRPVHWLHVSRDAQRPVSNAAGAVQQTWTEQGAHVRSVPVAGPAFWSAAELEDCPGLVSATVRALGHVTP